MTGSQFNRTGSGLGLYIASGIVQAHGGTIWAESTLGVGSAFGFTLTAAAPLPILGTTADLSDEG